MLHFVCIVGARPNFMKMAPLLRAFENCGRIRTTLIHTGQHYDQNLSEIFFQQLGMRRPDVSLEVGSGKQGEQTAKILERVEAKLEELQRSGDTVDRLVVVGDVNSTVAAAIAAVKMNIPVAHVEAGLRSFDRTMPEEINRILTDSISDCLLVSEPAGMVNLRAEGRSDDQLHLVGNVMIDTLVRLLPEAKKLNVAEQNELPSKSYFVATLHRPSNVDDPTRLGELVDCLTKMSQMMPCAFPIHPRTEKKLRESGLADRLEQGGRVRLLPPLGYLEFLSLVSESRLAVTDSGGLQEETTVLGIPCITIRPNTERPVTVDEGTNTLVSGPLDEVVALTEDVMAGRYKTGTVPEFWDGRAAERICAILEQVHGGR